MANTNTVWIDLENTPHVLFFNPIIKELRNRGYEVVTTARNYSQVYALADLFHLEYKKIGRHFGKNKLLKVIGLLTRVAQLCIYFASTQKPSLALSHGSRSSMMTAKALGIPCINAIDYEHTQHFMMPWPKLTIMPSVLEKNFKRGDTSHIKGYPGIKEDVYVEGFKPDNSVLNQLDILNGNIVVTIRPPATEAHYHNKKSEDFFTAIMEHLCNNSHICAVITPRTKKQEAVIS
jgi:uncharacterized protein